MVRYVVIALMAGLVLTGCERNPLMKLEAKKFDSFIQHSEFAKLADTCARYYMKGHRSKVTRASVACSSFTRELAKLAKQKGLVGSSVTYGDFRDKRLWQKWHDYVRAKGRGQ